MHNKVSPLSRAFFNRPSAKYQEIYKVRSIQNTVNITTSDDYQQFRNGKLVKHKLHKKGIFFEDSGVTHMEVQVENDNLHLFVFPDATFCLAETLNNQLHGYCVLLNQSAFLQCLSLKAGLLDGIQYCFVPSTRQFTKSLYKNNTLIRILVSQFVSVQHNPLTLFEGPTPLNLVATILNLDFKPVSQSVKSINIGQTMKYYGELSDNQPDGNGIIMSLNQLFIGTFNQGLLHGFGRIRFQNGDVCQGHFEWGRCCKFHRFTSIDMEQCFVENTKIDRIEYDDLIRNFKKSQSHLPIYNIPFIERVNKFYNSLLQNFADDARSRYLSKQASKILLKSSSDQPKQLFNDLKSQEVLTKQPSKNQLRPDVDPFKLHPNSIDHEEEDSVAQQLSNQAVSHQYSRNTPRFFQPKIRQKLGQVIFNKSREQNLLGPQLMNLVADNEFRSDKPEKLGNLVGKINRKPSQTDELHKITFKV